MFDSSDILVDISKFTCRLTFDLNLGKFNFSFEIYVSVSLFQFSPNSAIYSLCFWVSSFASLNLSFGLGALIDPHAE